MDKTCGSCAYKSDGVNAATSDYCYCIDGFVTRNTPACEEWRGSLRDEPVAGPPEGDLVKNVAKLDTAVED